MLILPNLSRSFRQFGLVKVRYFIVILISLSVGVGCDNDADRDSSPFTRLEKQQWYIDLQAPCAEDDVCRTAIFKASYLGQYVYFTQWVGGYCDPSFYAKLYDVNGNVVKIYDETNMVDFSKEVQILENIWVCKGK